LKLCILVDRIRWEEKKLYKASINKGIKASLVNLNEVYFDLNSPKFEEFDIVLQRCISHFHGLYVTWLLEQIGIKVVNDFFSSFITGNKLFATLLLNKIGIKTPKTFIAFNKEKIEQLIKELNFKAVLKPIIGSWGRHVVPIFSELQVKPILDIYEEIIHPPNNVYYIQELVNRPPRDIRMIVAKGEIIACVYRNSKSGVWATNVAQGAYTTKCEVNSDLEKIAEKISSIFKVGIFGIDMMESNEGYLVNDVNPTPEFRGAQACINEDIATKIIEVITND
jgi:[lysine-biosynthesis-protein LysW]--L-2-aminoadipate ligase